MQENRSEPIGHASQSIQLIVQNGNEVINAFPVIPARNEAKMFYVRTTCPACSAGAVGFRRCGDEQTIVLLCDECKRGGLEQSPDGISLETAIFPRYRRTLLAVLAIPSRVGFAMGNRVGD